MKIFYKKYIDEFQRELCLFGLKIIYSKNKTNADKRIKYDIKIGKFSFSLYKSKKHHKRGRMLRFDKEKQQVALIFAKCLRNFYAKNDNAKTLVLGASTARCSFIEDDTSINMAIDAQDLYYSHQIFKKFSYQIPNLKNLVIYYDVFSSGNDLDVSFMQHTTAFYKAFFDIPYKNKLSAIQKDVIKLENKLHVFDKYINKNLKNVPEDIMPVTHGGLSSKQELTLLAGAETKLSGRNNMLKYLDALIRDAGDLNILIVLAGRRKEIISSYPPVPVLFKTLYDLVENHKDKNIKILNCFDKFEDGDFVDLMHMNRNGAEKITKIINDNLL